VRALIWIAVYLVFKVDMITELSFLCCVAKFIIHMIIKITPEYLYLTN